MRLVTTNFDRLFEHVVKEIFDDALEVFHAPALPLGHQFSGVIHVHGCICHHDQMVLTDRDFGRAYLNEGWARRFLLGLFDTFTILFVGYSHSDTVMNYLVRALPPQREGLQRYALVSKSIADHRRWKHLKIETIPYPQHENDHRELDEAVSKLADYVRRGMVGWQREISAIADKPPHELNEEDEGIIAHALEDETKTEFFTNNASHPDWIEWLDKREHLTPLFGNGQLRDSDKILSWWLVDQYLENHPDLIFLLIGRHRTRVHPRFWDHIARKVGRDNETSPNTTILSQWITLLLSTAPEEGETPDKKGYVFTRDRLATIARRCITHQMIEEVLLIFDAMIRSRLSIRENHYLPRSETEEDFQFRKAFQIRLDVPLVGQHEQLDELWKAGLKLNLSQVAKPLLDRVVIRLEEQYLTLRTWGKTHGTWDPISDGRPAIEPHEKNLDTREIDVLINTARECLEWLVTNQGAMAAQWCNWYAASEVPLLRRLAVHGLSRRADLSPDDQIQWLLEYTDLQDSAIRHEVYQAVRHAYPNASDDCRMALIEKVQSYVFPNAEHPDFRKLSAQIQFDWLHWLHDTKPDCPFAQQAMDEVLAEYPQLIPREYPDFTSWRPGYEGVEISSLLTPETLLANHPSDLLGELLSLEDDE